MTRARKLLVFSLVLETLFVLGCLVPAPDPVSQFAAGKLLVLVFLTLALVLCGCYAYYLSCQGYLLREVGECLMLLGVVHLVSAGAQPELVWLPIVIGYISVLFSISVTWQNS